MSEAPLEESLSEADEPAPPATLHRGWWWGLALVYLALAGFFTVAQPMFGPPDEYEHLVVIQFLAREHRLPYWNSENGGEAGYEGQHPPLFYATMAVLYRLGQPLGERWRVYALRWVQVLVGLLGLALCRKLLTEAWPRRPELVWYGTALAVLMPNVLAYVSQINPDLWVLVGITAGLGLTVRLAREPENLRLAAGLGAVCGLATLCKISAAPLLLVALIVEAWPARHGDREALRRAARSAAVTLGVALALCGWWFVRNEYLYANPTTIVQVHHFGTGLEWAFLNGFGKTAWWTARLTYLSTFAPVDWPPEGIGAVLSYGLFLLLTMIAAAGLIAGRREPTPLPPSRSGRGESDESDARRVGLNVSGLALGLGLLAHQWSFWMADVEKNMGGRYLVGYIPGLALLLVAGIAWWERLARVLLPVAVVGVLLIDAACAWNIVAVLNPRWTPLWHWFYYPQ